MKWNFRSSLHVSPEMKFSETIDIICSVHDREMKWNEVKLWNFVKLHRDQDHTEQVDAGPTIFLLNSIQSQSL